MRKTNFSALESFYRIADEEDLILIKTILTDFTEAEQKGYILHRTSLASILEKGGDETFKWWINKASQLGCLDKMMHKDIHYFDKKAKKDPEFVKKLIPAFMGIKQQAEICLRYSNEKNALAVFQEIWSYIPPEQRREIISRNNYQLFVEIAGTNDAKLLKDFLQITEESGQKEQILPLDAIDISSPIHQALRTAIKKDATKSFKLLFSQLNPEQKSALMRTTQMGPSSLIALFSALHK